MQTGCRGVRRTVEASAGALAGNQPGRGVTGSGL